MIPNIKQPQVLALRTPKNVLAVIRENALPCCINGRGAQGQKMRLAIVACMTEDGIA
jgi:hypothetical protein